MIEGLFEVSYIKGGRPPNHNKREILNAIFYILRTGCQWRCLPNDLTPLGCYVGAANENDRESIKPALNNMNSKYTTITKMWTDMGYLSNELKAYIKENHIIDFEIVKRPPGRSWVHRNTPLEALSVRENGFKVEPRRWVIEKTFAWLGRNRQLSKEYELLPSSSENFIYIAMSRLLLRRNNPTT